ncbi:ligand-binding sensor domain-containing protein [Sandaracinus amylolyticus]|uniref:Uncharacterized protein n=1 Tax=Sandaracinus amylolyticus TaxID=927083 RepID=A0A0F6SGP9_9BACT|nr:hypothetical protein [Sandaracinus amylolyticus]AKF09074.1 Hypothetical protein DB32_006223 [Sandaracinus amylolyticus]
MRLVVVVAVLALACVARAQPRLEVVETIGATGDVHDVAVMPDGRVLAATSGGLVVIEGGRVARTITSADGLPGTRLRALDVIDGAIWAASIEGVAELDGALSVTRTIAIARARRVVRAHGALWIATYGDGLFRVRDGAPEPVTLGSDPAYARQTDALARPDGLWIATAGRGVVRLDANGVIRGRIRQAQGLSHDLVWDLEPDGDDVLVATLAGVSRVTADGAITARADETRAAQRLAVRDVRTIRRAGARTIVASWGGGVAELDGSRARPVRGASTRARAVVAQGDLTWIADDAGLTRVERGVAQRVLGGGLPSADLTALARFEGAIWIGTFDRGLARMDASGRIEPVRVAIDRWRVDPRINDLAVTRGAEGARLWIATDRGLFVHDGRRFVPIDDPEGPGDGHVTALHVDRHGALWAATSRVLARRDGDRWQRWSGDDAMPIAQLHAVTTDARGTVWVGSLHGLLRFDPSTGRFARESVATGALPVDWVTAVAPWRGGLLAGTYHGGLVTHTSGRFVIEREGATLPCGWINPHAIETRGERAWVGTLEGGLLVGAPGAWSRIGRDEGMPGDDVTDVLAIDEHEAWIATRAGLARVRVE